mmetsp:Transcript_6056/g.13033  ORF Transcript_6056/g.13033 Transcript_6056/m.13033 type:complete len:88 (+) Transcript_6056:1875-2138(+)
MELSATYTFYGKNIKQPNISISSTPLKPMYTRYVLAGNHLISFANVCSYYRRLFRSPKNNQLGYLIFCVINHSQLLFKKEHFYIKPI